MISEPTTLATDYILAALSVVFGIRLLRRGRELRQTSIRLVGASFLALAIASLTGGTYHGCRLLMSDLAAAALWKAAVYAVGLASFLMLTGALVASISRPLRDWLLAAATAKLGVYALWMATHDDFRYVIYDYAPALVAVLAAQAYAASRRASPSAPWIVAGVLTSFLAAAVPQTGFALHRHFNHNDLYHVIQMVAIWLLYRGGRQLTDLSGRAAAPARPPAGALQEADRSRASKPVTLEGPSMQRDMTEVLHNPIRLTALERTALLDSPSEEAFDRLTRLAMKLLKVPTAVVSLVDGRRQFFKSCFGVPEPWLSRRETPLSHSFCKHVVASGEPLVINDARQEPLVRDNLAIRDLGVVAYIGVPLATSQGQTLGSFCVIDARPRAWTGEDLFILRDIAAAAMTEIELRLKVREAESQVEGAREARARAEAAERRYEELAGKLRAGRPGVDL